LVSITLIAGATCHSQNVLATGDLPEVAPGVAYKNFRIPAGPWSAHIARVDRSKSQFEVHTVHARGRAIGLTTLSAQINLANRKLGQAVAGINGDFYQRSRNFAGDPRGLQITEGELISAPTGDVAFWVDAVGEPHATNVSSRFRVTWPDGKSSAFGLNSECSSGEAELYTPALGPSTRAERGIELVLERDGEGEWLPLRIGKTYKAKVREVLAAANTPIAADTMVLCVGPALAKRITLPEAGAVITLSTATTPNLEGASAAIGGGPVLVREGKSQKPARGGAEGYQTSSMNERHPRSAIGWTKDYFLLVSIDGRQEDSVGMTLSELGQFMAKVGCEGAMTLDGGGSTTLWCAGKVRNSPCDGRERAVANSLVIVRPETRAQR
jgi:hypothetical protein